jgi:hypothetical protein
MSQTRPFVGEFAQLPAAEAKKYSCTVDLVRIESVEIYRATGDVWVRSPRPRDGRWLARYADLVHIPTEEQAFHTLAWLSDDR